MANQIKILLFYFLLLSALKLDAQKTFCSKLSFSNKTSTDISTQEPILNYKGNVKFVFPKDFKEGVVKQYKYDNRYSAIEENNGSGSFFILFYKNIKSKYLIIIDKNNNQSFRDDQKYFAEATIPIQARIKAKFNVTKQPQEAVLSLDIIPFSKDYSHNDSLEKKWPVSLANKMCYRTRFNIDNKDYIVELRPGRIKNLKTQETFAINFSEPDSQLKKPDYSKIYEYRVKIDTILSYDKFFVIDSIDWNNSNVILTWGIRKDKYGYNVNDVVPNFKFQTIENNQIADLTVKPNKFLLIDFWGSWCTPCISNFPILKDLETSFLGKEVRFLGFAYEYKNSKDSIISLLRKYHIKSEQSIIFDENRNGSLISFLKISSYPSYILLDENRVIILKESGREGLLRIGEYLKNHL